MSFNIEFGVQMSRTAFVLILILSCSSAVCFVYLFHFFSSWFDRLVYQCVSQLVSRFRSTETFLLTFRKSNTPRTDLSFFFSSSSLVKKEKREEKINRHMASTLSSPSLCQHAQCDAYQFTICRHCQLFLCIRHLAEHQQQFPSDFQRLLDDARRQQAQLASFDQRLKEQRFKFNQVVDNEMEHYRQLNAYVQSKSSLPTNIAPDDFVNMRSCLARLQQTASFLPIMDKIGQLIGEHESATGEFSPSTQTWAVEYFSSSNQH